MIGHMNNLELNDLEKFVNLLFTTLLKYARDASLENKVKFILKDSDLSSIQFSAICDINIISLAKPKTTDSGASQKKNAKKQVAGQKYIHEFEYFDKSPYLPFGSDKCKILCFSHNFEKMIRFNILDCINKLFKIEDLDKEVFLNTLEESYKIYFIDPFINELANSLKKEIITFDVDLTPQQQQ